MSAKNQFKFLRDLDLTEDSLKPITNKYITSPKNGFPSDDNKLGKMVMCHFRDVKEQTIYSVGKPFQMGKDSQVVHKKDQRCYYKDSSIRIYSRGGSEFVIPTLFNVEEVYPIDNGIIAKLRYDRDKLMFDASQIRKEPLSIMQRTSLDQQKEWTYVTLTEHPLDDIHPLSFQGVNIMGQTNLLPSSLTQTQLELIYVSYKIPLVFLYNPLTQTVIFGLLKKRPDSSSSQGVPPPQSQPMAGFEDLQETHPYIRSIEPESRHPEIFVISREHKLVIEEVFQVPAPNGPPTKVMLSKGLSNSFELNIGFLTSSSHRFDLYQCDIRYLNRFKLLFTLQSVTDAVQLRFIERSQETLDFIPKGKARQINEGQQNEGYSVEVQAMKERVRLLKKETVIVEGGGRKMLVYQGACLVYSFDAWSIIESQMNEKNLLSKANRIDSLSHAHGSKITIHLNNGASRRVTMKVYITDFLLNSIMNVFRILFPVKLYESLTQDLIETFMKCNIELKNSTGKSESNHSLLLEDQFGKFTSMLLAIITGDHSQFSIFMKQVNTSNSQVSGSNNSNQMTPQQSSANKTATPTQTLQTKILRSSTTSFATDQMAARRKINNPTTSQPASYAQIQQQPGLSTQLRATVLGRQTSTGVNSNSATQAQRRVGGNGGSTGPEVTNTPLTINPGPVIHHSLSANPFADLINSDFHKENFAQNFASLLPPGMNLTVPVPTTTPQHQPDPSPIQLSPTKSTPSKQQVQAALGGASYSRLNQPKSATPYTQPDRKSNASPVSNSQSPVAQTSETYHFKTSKSELLNQFNQVFNVLHLMHEDLKLNKLRDNVECPKIAMLLLKLAIAIDPYKKASFIEYYINEHKEVLQRDEVEVLLRKAYKDGSIMKEGTDIEPVPKIYKWIEQVLKGQQDGSIFSLKYPLFFETSRKVTRLYEILTTSQFNSYLHPALIQTQGIIHQDRTLLSNLSLFKYPYSLDLIDYRDYLKHQKPTLHLFEKVLFTMREEHLDHDDLKKLPSIIALPLLEIIRYARLFQQDIQTVPHWPDSLYKLIQREDILNNLRLFERGKPSSGAHRGDQSTSRKGLPVLTKGLSSVFGAGATTFEEMQQEHHRREMESNIMKTASDFINAQTGPLGQVETGADRQGNNKISDFIKNRFSNDTRYKEVTNFLNSQSEMIVKLDHIANRESLTEEQLGVEKQKLIDKLFLRHLSKSVGRGALQFGALQTLPTETLKIPKINQTGFVPITESYMQVEFKDDASKDIMQWPDFHNGVASTMKIALTFNKNRSGSEINQMQHTRNWIMYHKPTEPKYEHGGFCLAMGLLGQLDTLQPTDIYQHLKSTHDATTIGILLGRAASKIGTMDDHDTRTLCIHIPYLLPPTLSLEVSLSVQSAAVIGAGLLYKGTSNRLMTEMLLAQIGRKPLSDKAIEREGYALASGIALGLVNLGIGNKMQGLTDLKLDERLIRYVEGGKMIDLPQSMLSQNFNHDNTKCSAIKEGDMVNVHITSQGALIALALIHLKSNNQQISDQLSLPQTFFSLESVRPSFLLLKILCKNLIMWDDIHCTQQWIDSQIPLIIKDIYTNDISQVEAKYQQKYIEDGIDYSTVALCYVNIIAGAIFSIGFKYAGTGNREAFRIVQEYSNFFRKLKIMQSNKDSIGMVHTNLTKNQVDKNTVETCLCVSAFAMSIIMAGTGDIECFRTLRVLRKRFEHDMHYGFNMAISMSLGFLFLGGGAFTLSRNNLAIASLICSLYPIFPTSPSDNRYHLQALRHFYVLAIESRLLQAKDIDTGEFLNIQMNVEVLEEQSDDHSQKKTVKIVTPDIINGVIKKIEVQNDLYHNVSLSFSVPSNSKATRETQMEVDEGSASTSHAQAESRNLIDKRMKIFEQFDFQKIVYVKKKTSSNLQQSAKSQTYMIKDKKSLIDQRLQQVLASGEAKNRTFAEEVNEIHQSMGQIKDQTIEQFNKTFTQVGKFAKQTHFNEIEDVLLAQSRDNFNQMSPAEFFRLQDLYDQIKELMVMSYVPESLKDKMNLLQHLHDLYFADKMEFLPLMLDSQFKLSAQVSTLFHTYTHFLSSRALYEELSSHERHLNLVSSFALLPCPPPVQQQQPLPLKTQAQTLLTILASPHQLAKKSCTFDLFVLRVIKQVIDQALGQLKAAEAESVKKYRFQKTNGLKIEQGTPEFEINEMLKGMVAQMTAEEYSQEVINEVILTALIAVEK